MDFEQNAKKELSIFHTAILGAEEILRNLESVSWGKNLFVKNDDFLNLEKHQQLLADKIEFFVPELEVKNSVEKLKELFLPINNEANNFAFTEESKENSAENQEKMQIFYCSSKNGMTFQENQNIWKILLEIWRKPYRIPLELHLIPYTGREVFPLEKKTAGILNQKEFTYRMFPPEELLAVGFYELLKELEFVKDLSWYKEIYELLLTQPVEGRRVWEGLIHMLEENPIPSLEGRLHTIKGYKDYDYMKRRWKSECRRKKERYPQWEQVISMIDIFFTPIFEGVLKDQVFLGDWMPQLGRYLD